MSAVVPPTNDHDPSTNLVRRVVAHPNDPDEYRMTFGEHLDELRTRLILGLGGFVVAFIFCLSVVRDWVFQFLCKPLLAVMHSYELNTMLFEKSAGEAFTVYLKTSSIAAVLIASPWLLWQVWKFVSAGLYPHERKTVTRYIPLFLTLLLGGAAFAFYVVLPMTLQFLIYFTVTIPMPPQEGTVLTAEQMPGPLPNVMVLPGDPPPPVPNGSYWFNSEQSRFKMWINGKTRIIQFTSENLVSPLITLGDYTDMLLLMLLTFGLSFETPLVVLALVRLGIFPLEELRAMRRIVYFVIVIVAAVITPGDAITATVALVLPLGALYELGLILARDPKPEELAA